MTPGRIARFLRRLLRRTAPRPGSVRRVGDGTEVFRDGAWEPLPRYRAAGSGRPGPDSPALAIRCPQTTCGARGAGTVWPWIDDDRGLWAADCPHQREPSLHGRAVDAARWVRTQHDKREHPRTRWTPEHLDAGSAADTAAARALTDADGSPP